MSAPSLHRQLLLRLVPALIVIWICATVFITWRSYDELTEAYADQLDQLSHTLAQLLDSRLLTPQEAIETVAARHDRNYFVLVYAEGRPVLRSSGVPDNISEAVARGQLRSDAHLLSFAQTHNGDLHVVAGLEREEIGQLVVSLLIGTVGSMALALLLMMGIIWLAIRRSLAPIETMRRDLSLRGTEAFHPVATSSLPEEILPLAEAMNLLLSRLSAAFDAERRFVADASHELRTPLTAIRAQAEAIDRRALPQETSAALDRIISGVERSSRLAQQLLRLARADAQTTPVPEALDLAPVVRSVVSDLFPLAVHHGSDLELDCQPAKIQATREDIEMILCNLIENAILHGGTGNVHIGSGPFWLSVEDAGPGIPPEAHEAMFARFRRGEHTTADGAGLGLPIVAAVAARLGARVSLARSERLGGLAVCVEFRENRP